MKTRILLSLFFIFLFSISCTSTDNKVATDNPETPAPLNDESKASMLSKVDVKSLRGGNSLVDELYADLASKQPELKTLENQFYDFYEARQDSVADFNRYNAKSDSYYSSANSVLGNIKDSVLRQRLMILIKQSQDKMIKKTSRFSALIAEVDKEIPIMEDYRQTLKLLTTLPIIENYQDKNMPAIKPVKYLSDKARQLRSKTQQLVKKYEYK